MPGDMIEIVKEGADRTATTDIHYAKPQVFDLGAMEKVQAYYTGSYRDGPNSSYWYNG